MKTRPHLIPALIVAIMLLVAVAPMPYGYFQFLRWAVCGVAVFIAFKSYAWKQPWAVWLFGAVAVMFNPILPIDLTREIWQPIDLASALLFSLSILLLPNLSSKAIGWITAIALSLFLMLTGISLLSAYNAAIAAYNGATAAYQVAIATEAATSGVTWILVVVFLLGGLVFLVISFASGLKLGSMGSNRLLLIIAIVLLLFALLTVGYVW